MAKDKEKKTKKADEEVKETKEKKEEKKSRLRISWNACDCAGCFSSSGRTYA